MHKKAKKNGVKYEETSTHSLKHIRTKKRINIHTSANTFHFILFSQYFLCSYFQNIVLLFPPTTFTYI